MYLMTASFSFFQEGTGGGGGGLMGFLPIILIFAIFYFILIRPQVKQQKKHQALVDNLKKGDRVVTNGGIWGEIDVVEPAVVRLKVNDKTKIMVSRTAIASIQPETSKGETESDGK